MNIRIVVTPTNVGPSSELGALAESLKKNHPRGWIERPEERAVRIAPGVGRDRLDSLVARWAKANSGLVAGSGRIAVEEISATSETEKPETSGESGGAKPRDLNGTAARAALLKMLSSPALANARMRFTRETSSRFAADGSEGSVTAMPLPGAGEGAWAVAVGFAGGGARAGVIDAARAATCAGGTLRAIAASFHFGDDESLAPWERVVAITETARELRVPIFWIQAVDDGQTGAALAAIAREEHVTEPFPRAAGERLIFLGEAAEEIAGSRFLEAVHGGVAGEPAAADYAREKKLHALMQTLAKARAVTAAHSVGAGGLLVALCGMVLGAEKSLGARVDVTSLGGTRADALLFGEVQGRAIVAVAAERVGTVISEAHMHGIPAALIGEVTEEPLLELKTRSLATEWSLAELETAWGVRRSG